MTRLRQRQIKARFQLTITPVDGPSEVLLDRTLETGCESPWRGRKIPLWRFGFKRVTMCVSTEAEGEMKNPFFALAWGNPLIRSSVHHPEAERSERRITEEERKLREQQLRALGYVN